MPVTIPHAVDLGFGPKAERFVGPQQRNLLRRSQYEHLCPRRYYRKGELWSAGCEA
jgi:hypothetical protein